ncbi:hypothetical protein Leryth_024559 [Lithospermum erythrorhizon]|nr:hypothetical protein Leryth_024559 [Lithospermum erythrorhizon]
MSSHIAVNILSDDEDDDVAGGTKPVFIDITTPTPVHSKKKQKMNSLNPNPTISTVFIIDDDPTPPLTLTSDVSTTPIRSFVPETPFVDDDSVVKGCKRYYSNSPVPLISEVTPISEFPKPKGFDEKTFVDYPGILKPCSVPETPLSELAKTEIPVAKHPEGIGGLIYLASDDESEEEELVTKNKGINNPLDANELERSSRLFDSNSSFGNCNILQSMEESLNSWSGEAGTSMAHSRLDSDTESLPMVVGLSEETDEHKYGSKKCPDIDELKRKKTMSKEERDRLKEEKKQQKEQEKLQKAAEKAEAAEMKKLHKEKQKWEKGKLANKSIVAEIDRKVVEMGSVGGHLLTRFGEKDVSYRITSNPIERSILWTMTIPEHLAQISEETEVRYILLVYNAEEFCNIVVNESLMNHVFQVQCHYPYHTICLLTNRLMAYINKREHQQYKNPNFISWTRPPVEEVLSKLTTHFARVHTRQCIDEAELAEHIVGLTCSLASCQFRKKLTRLSVNANGSSVSKDCVDKNLIKKNTCLPWFWHISLDRIIALVLKAKWRKLLFKQVIVLPAILLCRSALQ